MWVELLFLSLAVLIWWLWQVRSSQRHWQSLGLQVPWLKFPFGNHPFFVFDGLKKKDFQTASREQYDAVGGKNCRFYGGYSFSQRFIVVTDPELAKDVLVRNFNCFSDRHGRNSDGFMISTGTLEDDVNLKQFFVNKGEAWKEQRSTFSPIFTSGKLKNHMIGHVREVCQKLMDSLHKEAEGGAAFELKKKFGKMSMDTIASCAFGVDARSFSDEGETEFAGKAKNMFRFTPAEFVKFLALSLSPATVAIFKMLKISIAKPEVGFFHSVIKQTMDHRARSGVRRNDFVDLMLDAMKDQGKAGVEKEEQGAGGGGGGGGLTEQIESDGKLKHRVQNRRHLDELTVVGSALNLMTAGYDTTSTALSFLGYYLARNPAIQEMIQAEIDDLKAQEEEDGNGNFPSYDGIFKLEYLDMALHEVLRMHPPLAMLQRACTADYKIPGSDIVVKAGDEVFINVIGLHYDPDLFPEPEKFDPEHFSKENKEKRHPYSYLGFGQGPRNCIGMRFALLEVKLAMTKILSEFTIVECSETPEKLTIDPESILGAPKEDLMVKLRRRY